MYTPFKFLAILFVTCSSAVLAFAPPPTSAPTAPTTDVPPTQSTDSAPINTQTDTAEITNTTSDTKEDAPASNSKPPQVGELVEGKAVNPYTYSPDEIPTDPNNPAETDLRAALTAMGPVAIEWYQHVQTLSNPFFEGRVPGSRGND